MAPRPHGLLAVAPRRPSGIPTATSVCGLVLLLFVSAATFSDIFLSPSQSAPSSPSVDDNGNGSACDVSRGEWVLYPGARPYYTNATCESIQDYQNCGKYGRRSLEFLQWRWKPDSCELRRFDATHFFQLMRGKSFLFVGDSVSSSHMLSLVCILSQVESPRHWHAKHFEHWCFEGHNFTISFFWTPFQVRWSLTSGGSSTVGVDRKDEVFTGLSDLYLDEPDDRWTTAVAKYDYVVVSGAHWFTRPALFYEQGRLMGCHDCNMSNVTAVPPQHAQRAVFLTVLRALDRLKGFNGTAVVRTVVPMHYENGGWLIGGRCDNTRPFRGGMMEIEMLEREDEFYKTQVEEFRAAERIARENGVRLRLLDVSNLMQLRPDGRYGHRHRERGEFDVDCLHWCLPGPIDVWNEMLFQILAS